MSEHLTQPNNTTHNKTTPTTKNDISISPWTKITTNTPSSTQPQTQSAYNIPNNINPNQRQTNTTNNPTPQRTSLPQPTQPPQPPIQPNQPPSTSNSKNFILTADRTLRNQGLPPNSCSYIAAIDLMYGNTTFRHLSMTEEDEPALVNALKRNTDRAKLTGCILNLQNRLKATSNNLIGIKLNDTEDPYLIIQAIRKTTQPYNNEIITEPITKLSCGCPMVLGDL